MMNKLLQSFFLAISLLFFINSIYAGQHLAVIIFNNSGENISTSPYYAKCMYDINRLNIPTITQGAQYPTQVVQEDNAFFSSCNGADKKFSLIIHTASGKLAIINYDSEGHPQGNHKVCPFNQVGTSQHCFGWNSNSIQISVDTGTTLRAQLDIGSIS